METYAFCEYGDCRVLLFQIEDPAGDTAVNGNCPSCGRFGRTKDKASAGD